VLDQHLAGRNIRGRRPISGKFCGQFRAVYANVDVTGAGHLEFLKAGNRTDPGDDLFRNLARRLAKFPGEFEIEFGSAYSPNSIFGGCSTTMFVISKS